MVVLKVEPLQAEPVLPPVTAAEVPSTLIKTFWLVRVQFPETVKEALLRLL